MDEYYKDYLEFFSKRVAELRSAEKISAQKMSKTLGQSNGYIGQIERKHNLPSMSVFLAMCDFLKITPKEFFDEDVESPAVYLELMNNAKKLDEEQLINVSNIVKGLLKK